jgi:hypothetical protein
MLGFSYVLALGTISIGTVGTVSVRQKMLHKINLDINKSYIMHSLIQPSGCMGGRGEWKRISFDRTLPSQTQNCEVYNIFRQAKNTCLLKIKKLHLLHIIIIIISYLEILY